jgi:hypothetical protein
VQDGQDKRPSRDTEFALIHVKIKERKAQPILGKNRVCRKRSRKMSLTDIFLKIAHRIEFNQFKDAIKRNPNDPLIRARFAKFCLNHYFNHQGVSRLDEMEAVQQFEKIDQLELRELEIYYLMGKYYQGQNDKMAAEVYLKGIKRFNDFVDRDDTTKHEFVEMAFNIALNLLKLENNHAGPELELFFKIVRHTYLKNFLTEKVVFQRVMGWPPPATAEQKLTEDSLLKDP